MRVRVGGGDVCPCEYPRMKEKADTHISRKQLINYHGSVASLSPGSLLAGSELKLIIIIILKSFSDFLSC